MIQTFVEFRIPGVFVSETETRRVKSRRRPRSIPKYAYCYRFFDQAVGEAELDGEKIEVTGEQRNVSGRYFLGGTVYDRERIPKTRDNRILISNAENNGWNKVIRCRTGNWQPFLEDDQVVSVRKAS